MKVAEFGVSLRGWLRSSDIGCGFEDAGPVRPEDCFPVPRVSVVRGGASASPAGREFEIAYVDAESGARRLALIDAWSVPFEECMRCAGFRPTRAAQSCRPLVDGHDRIPCRV